jgi:hypothetical protein
MDGFKKSTKMQCFKEGGSVKYESRKQHKEEMSADVKKDKSVIKKAIGMHDKQEHPGEKTDLSKLKKGGRAKKAVGTVKKYKAGGSVENQYGAKKTDKDIKDIANTKRQKPTMLCDGGKASGPSKYKTGGKVKKMADGGMLGGIGNALGAAGTHLKNNVMGTPEQNRIAKERMDMIARKKAAEKAALLGGMGGTQALEQGAMAGAMSDKDAAMMQAPAQDPMGAPTGMPPMKKGGKAKKMNTGGMSGPISPVAQEIIEGKRPPQTTPGVMTPEERRASVAKAFGAGSKKMKTGGTCS